MKKIIFLYIIFAIVISQSIAKLDNVVIDMSECGLKIAYAYQKVTKRYFIPEGSGLPCKLQIDSLPNKCYEIIDAFIWTTLSDSIEKNEPISLTIINPMNQVHYYNTVKTGQKIDKCWGELHTSGYRASVKNSITGNGEYIVNTNTLEWEVDGFFLLIIYKDLTEENEGHIFIKDGLITEQGGRLSYDTLKFKPACDFSSDSYFFSVVSDMQYDYHPEFILHLNAKEHRIICQFWNVEFRKSEIKKNQSSSVFGVEPLRNDCYSWVLSGYYYRTKTCKNCYFPSINIKAIGSDICPGDSVILTADGGYYYEWSSIPAGFKSNSKDVFVKPLTTTKYVVKGLSEDSCYVGYDTVHVNVYPKPKAVIIPSGPTSFCRGDSVVLTAAPNDNNHKHKWSNGATSDRITVKESGNYTAFLENQFGCKDSVSIDVTVLENPKVKILTKNDFRVCLGDSIELFPDDNFKNYRWSSGETKRSIFVKYPGIYHLTIIDSNGCRAYDTVEVKKADLTLSYLSKIDLDSVCIGETKIFSFRIYNTGKDNYNITNFNFLKGNSSLKVLSVSNFPVNLLPGDSLELKIIFSPDEIRAYSDSLQITVEKEPCREIKTLFVRAIGVPKFFISIPDTVGYVKDDNFCFPVFIKLDAKENTKLLIDYIAEVSFDSYVFLPKTPFSRIQNDRRIVTLGGKNFLVTDEPRLLAEICGLVLLGDSLTKTSVVKFSFKDSKICLETIDGNFAITGICAIKSSRVLLLKDVEMNIFPQPAENEVEILVNSQNIGEHSIELFDIKGLKFYEIKWSGSNNLTNNKLLKLDLNAFSSGLYYIVYKNEFNFIKKPLIILK